MLSTQQGEQPGCNADVAQLVEHHLAKVRVAGSSPVIRSEAPPPVGRLASGWRGREARQRPAKPYTRVRIPSPPRNCTARAIGAAVARFLDTEEVTGSNPVSPTRDGRPLDSESAGRGPFAISAARQSGGAMTHTGLYLDCAHAFVGIVARVGAEEWTRPALATWDVRALVGHTGRALTTVVDYLAEPEPADDVVITAPEYYVRFA